MQAGDQTTGVDNVSQARLYMNLIAEEIHELRTADNEAEELKELMDCLVVVIGYGLSRGWNLHGAWQEVWASNMSKIDPVSGKVIKRADGKILKPETYRAADVSRFISKKMGDDVLRDLREVGGL